MRRRKTGVRRLRSLFLIALLLEFSLCPSGHSGAFVEANATNGYDTVTHPEFYQQGVSGNLTISVSIDPTSAHKDDMVIPLKNAIKVWNDQHPTTGNLVTGIDNKLGDKQYDFESVLLHKEGHALGLAHPNLGGFAPTPPAWCLI